VEKCCLEWCSRSIDGQQGFASSLNIIQHHPESYSLQQCVSWIGHRYLSTLIWLLLPVVIMLGPNVMARIRLRQRCSHRANISGKSYGDSVPNHHISKKEARFAPSSSSVIIMGVGGVLMGLDRSSSLVGALLGAKFLAGLGQILLPEKISL
jgi:uncharacterized Tic20 family protein